MAARRSSDPGKFEQTASGEPRAALPDDGRAAAAPDAAEQTRLFEEGVRLLQRQRFVEARDCFLRAAQGPIVEMAHAARQRVRMCELRLSRSQPDLRTAEDRYNYAVLLLNQRRWEEAEAQLRKALEEQPQGGHLHYALALCLCWRGDMTGAYQSLQRAIELDPSHRITARNDPDLAPFVTQPPLADLLKPERDPGP